MSHRYVYINRFIVVSLYVRRSFLLPQIVANMVLCRSSRSGYEPLGNENEYVAYKFLTRITLCCLAFAFCIIVMLYVSDYCCSVGGNSAVRYAFGVPSRWDKMPRKKEVIDGDRMCSLAEEGEKFDCLPRGQIDEKSCKARGCCWQTGSSGAPWCFYPKSYGGYKYLNVTRRKNGARAFLVRTFPSSYPNDVKLLRLDAQYQSNERLHVRVSR